MGASELDDVHSFWFGELPDFGYFPQDRFPLWFVQNDETDAMLRQRFGKLVEAAIGRDWNLDLLTPAQQTGLIVLLDQMPRSIYRGTPQAYAADPSARKWAGDIASRGLDGFKLIERIFLILPLGHSETLADQDRALSLAQKHYFPYAPPDHFFTIACKRQSELYRDIIARFGRFPHRNVILGRATTAEEARFMSETDPGPA